MLPDGWREMSLKELAVEGIQNGVFNKPEDVGKGYRLINVSDLYNEPHIDYCSLKLLDVDKKTFEKFQVNEGDIFYTRSSLKLEGIAHCNIFNEEKPDVIFECHIMRVRPNRNLVAPKFLHLYSHSHIARKQFIRNAKTTTMTTIDQGGLGSVTVYLPPLEEQQEIVKIAYEWDIAADQLVKLIETKQKQKKALMQRLLTGKHRFPEFANSKDVTKTKYGDIPADWDYVHINHIASHVSTKNKDSRELPVLSCTKHKGLVNSQEYFGKQVYSQDLSTYRIIKRGQFAYATNHIEEGSIGYQDLHEEAVISPMYTVFKTNNKIDDGYLYKLLKTELYRHIFEASTNASVDRRGSLRWPEFSKLYIPLPSISEQKKIAAFLDIADKEIDLLTKKLEAYQEQKKGLMQQLLTGKKRVKIDRKEAA